LLLDKLGWEFEFMSGILKNGDMVIAMGLFFLGAINTRKSSTLDLAVEIPHSK